MCQCLFLCTEKQTLLFFLKKNTDYTMNCVEITLYNQLYLHQNIHMGRQ